MSGSALKLTPWTLALTLTLVASTFACRADTDPEALFAEAEELRQAYRKEASERAIVAYGDARAAWVREGDHERAATASRKLGATHEQLGLLADALQDYLEAERVCGGTCSPLLESAVSSDIGLAQAGLADDEASQQSALDYCRDALSLAREAGGRREEAEALSCAGEAAYHRGDLDEALRLHGEAREIWESLADPHGLAQARFYEGSVRSDLSQFGEAKGDLEAALSLWISSRDRRGEAMARVALGQLERRRGNYQNALNRLRVALDRLEPSGDLVWEASAFAGIGGVYLDMADGAQALSYLEASVERIKNTGLAIATWDFLLAVGRVHLTLEAPREALQRFQDALELAEKTKSDHWKQAYALHHVSLALQALGQPEASLRSLERALVLQESVEDPRLEAAIRMAMGNAFELEADYVRADQSFRRAAELNRASDNRVGEAAALFAMARVAQRGRVLEVARDHIERALQIAESLRTAVESRELRTSYFASVHAFHELYIDVLMRLHAERGGQGLAAAAFGASERARARSLLESLVEAGVDLRAGVEPNLLETEANLRQRLDATVEQRIRSERTLGRSAARAWDDDIADLEAKYDLVLAEIRSTSPRYSALIRREPLTLHEVQDGLLDDDTLLLEYALGSERSYLWAVSKDEYASFELGPRAGLEEDAEHLYELLTTRAQAVAESLQKRNRRVEEADAAYWKASARLSERLLGPVADRMEGKKLIFVPDGALQHLPFGALPVPGSGTGTEGEAVPMIVAHEIVNLPSASSLAVLRQEARGKVRPKGTVAVFADPVFTADDPRIDGETVATADNRDSDENSFLRSGELEIPRLEATRREAEAIVEAAPRGTTFQAIDFDASRSVATSGAISAYRILHFATHGISNVDNPTMSGILLSMFDEHGEAQEGLLRLHDIYDLDLSADLVVLSACNTALGRQIRGEGTVGIVRAFMYAGAERVVATLWKVDDEATRELMSHFYQGMFEGGLSPSAALRSAQLTLWRESEWHAPFYWGAFVLQGEWR